MTDSLPRTDSFNTQGRWWDVMTNWIEHPGGLGLVALKLKVSSQDAKSAGKLLSEKRKCQHTMEGAFQGLWWELFYQWEHFQLYPTIHNQWQCYNPSKSLWGEESHQADEKQRGIWSWWDPRWNLQIGWGKRTLWLLTLTQKLENDEEIPHDMEML